MICINFNESSCYFEVGIKMILGRTQSLSKYVFVLSILNLWKIVRYVNFVLLVDLRIL